MSIFYHSETIFKMPAEGLLTQWLCGVVEGEGWCLGDVNYIFCSDAMLLELNKRYLQHDTLTDILTFDYSEADKEVAGDIYISVERVRENADEFAACFEEELCRVMVHGVLHLMGYDDRTPALKGAMRLREDHYLRASILRSIFSYEVD